MNTSIRCIPHLLFGLIKRLGIEIGLLKCGYETFLFDDDVRVEFNLFCLVR